jgi:hypothetical protein
VAEEREGLNLGIILFSAEDRRTGRGGAVIQVES